MADGEPSVDWFGICGDPETDPAKKCVFCKDAKRNPLEDPESESNSYVTTDCRHRVCGVCAKNFVPGQVKCPLCGSRIQSYKKEPPEYIALRILIEVRKEVYKEWNLVEEDFPSRKDYDRFLEEREDLVQEILYSKTLEKESKIVYEQKIASKRAAFKEKHRDAINRNDARVAEYRNQMHQKIKADAKAILELRKAIEREKDQEEQDRIYREEERNAQRLGTTIRKPTDLSKSTHAEEENKTYLYAKNDPLANNGPPPMPIQQENTPKVEKMEMEAEFVWKAGGLGLDIVQARKRSEMQAGWDLMI